MVMASSPTGQVRTHTPHSMPWKAMQRSSSSARSPSRSPVQPAAGMTSAPVGHTEAQNIPSQATHGWLTGSMIGVPAASPAEAGAETTASTGQASMQ